MIKLHDRIKERSFTIGTGNFALSGVFSGFSSFGSVYQDGDKFFYVANDGSNFEIGSGLYISATNQIQRFPIKSSNSNNLVNFPEGLKEVYVNYPATNSVFNGSGIDILPVNSGLTFWTSSNSVSSENYFYIDSGNHRLGINKSNPGTAIDVGGSLEYSKIRSSGFIVGLSGIYFPSGNNNDSSYLGGQQLTHYEMNQVNEETGSNALIELSGAVNQNILLKKQNAGHFFAGPISGCIPSCDPNYPVFRPIDISDLPELSGTYATLDYIRDEFNLLKTTIYNDGRLGFTNTNIDSSGTIIKYNRFSNEVIDEYKISLLDVDSNRWVDYEIPLTGISFNVNTFFDESTNSYKLYDIFVYYDSGSASLQMSGVAWDNNHLFSSGLLYDFANSPNNFTVNYATDAYIDSDLLLNETPFEYASLLVNGNTLSEGDTVLVTSQIDTIENGVYEILSHNANSGIFARGPTGFYPGDTLLSGSKFYSYDSNKMWYLDVGGYVTIGTDNIVLSNWGDFTLNSTRSFYLTNIQNNAFLFTNDKSKRYIGTIFTVDKGLVIDSSRHRHIFNAHNKIFKPIKISNDSTSWNYLFAVWRSIPTSYIPYGSVIVGLTNSEQNVLSLEGILHFSSSNLQANEYTVGINLNDNILPSSGVNILNIIDHISVDYNDNITTSLKTTCKYEPDIGFNVFGLSEKGKSGNSIVVQIDDNVDSNYYGGLFGTWYC